MCSPRKFLALLLSVLGAARAFAGFTDFVNGVRLGQELPAHEFAYLGASPETKGKVLLIDFWATWCAPCLEAMPELAKIHADYGARGLVVVSVTKEPAGTVEAFLKRQPLSQAVALDTGGKLHGALRIKAIPYAIVVDRRNKIVWRGQPSALTAKVLDALLKTDALAGVK
ncbi:MAG: TlpA family protein disulfide reductase [Opitutae bacterium]|nr:TlpA family protein disulfide reductase [Opitutae bacterium]